MVATASTMLELGTSVPPFELPDAYGKTVSSDDFQGAQALLIGFICNHCPFVKHIRHELATLARDYRERGVALVAINSNDIENYPADAPEKMREEIETIGYEFPYLLDESQEVAKQYRAACTPEFYLFDSDGKLVYRGQFDGSRPGNDVPVDARDVRRALDALLTDEPVPAEQTPSIGCNIKWKPGNEPDYFGG